MSHPPGHLATTQPQLWAKLTRCEQVAYCRGWDDHGSGDRLAARAARPTTARQSTGKIAPHPTLP